MYEEDTLAYALGQALAAIADSQPWMRRARCSSADPSTFFPSKGSGPANAKRICATCPVTEECLAYALEMDEAEGGGAQQTFGVFGGLTGPERRRLARSAVA